MSEYKKYTNEDIEKAKSVDTLDFLMEKGYSFRRAGNEYKCVEHDSLVVNNDRRRWFWNSRSVGGHSVIDFCTKIEGKKFPDALKEILGYSPKETYTATEKSYAKTTKTAQDYNSNNTVPEKSHQRTQGKQETYIKNTKTQSGETYSKSDLILPKSEQGKFTRLYAYLCKKRGICPELVHELVTTKRLYQDEKGNAVFLGYDRGTKRPQYASLKGTSDKQFRGDVKGSKKEVGFFIGDYNAKLLCVFEAPIDAMSFATMLFKADPKKSWKNVGLLSLGGTSLVALDHFIQSHPDVKRIVSAMDNDEAGLKSSEKIQEVYGKSHSVKFLNFSGKDVNEALTKFPLSPVTQSDNLLHVVKHISEANRSQCVSQNNSNNILDEFQNFQTNPNIYFNPAEYPDPDDTVENTNQNKPYQNKPKPMRR